MLYCFVIGCGEACRIAVRGKLHGSLHTIDVLDSYHWMVTCIYVLMSTLTGLLAGLVGIGGGLIFSPFFIQMGIDPHVAVASSATCVIFTSASTSFQYIFTDRV